MKLNEQIRNKTNFLAASLHPELSLILLSSWSRPTMEASENLFLPSLSFLPLQWWNFFFSFFASSLAYRRVELSWAAENPRTRETEAFININM